MIKISLLLALILALVILVERQIAPVFNRLAEQQAHILAMEAIQSAVNRQMSEEDVGYQDLLQIEKDESGRVTMMIPHTQRINRLISATVQEIDAAFSALTTQEFSVPLGAVTGSKFFSHWGPQIKLKFRPAGAVSVELVDEFSAAGLNQTRHRLLLHIEGEIAVAVPFSGQNIQVSSDLLLAEGIIVGPIPDTYLNIEGGVLNAH